MRKLSEYINEEILKNSKRPLLRLINIYFLTYGQSNCILNYRIGQNLYTRGYTKIGRYFYTKLQRNYGVYIHPDAQIGIGLSLPHPVGIVIGQGVKIGENSVIYQNTTFGGARRGDWQANNYPTIAAGVVVFSGAVIVGSIDIGASCTIGANAVVTKNFPNNCTVAGVPAKIVKVNHEN